MVLGGIVYTIEPAIPPHLGKIRSKVTDVSHNR